MELVIGLTKNGCDYLCWSLSVKRLTNLVLNRLDHFKDSNCLVIFKRWVWNIKSGKRIQKNAHGKRVKTVCWKHTLKPRISDSLQLFA